MIESDYPNAFDEIIPDYGLAEIGEPPKTVAHQPEQKSTDGPNSCTHQSYLEELNQTITVLVKGRLDVLKAFDNLPVDDQLLVDAAIELLTFQTTLYQILIPPPIRGEISFLK